MRPPLTGEDDRSGGGGMARRDGAGVTTGDDDGGARTVPPRPGAGTGSPDGPLRTRRYSTSTAMDAGGADPLCAAVALS